jgi:hypothetical protein
VCLDSAFDESLFISEASKQLGIVLAFCLVPSKAVAPGGFTTSIITITIASTIAIAARIITPTIATGVITTTTVTIAALIVAALVAIATTTIVASFIACRRTVCATSPSDFIVHVFHWVLLLLLFVHLTDRLPALTEDFLAHEYAAIEECCFIEGANLVALDIHHADLLADHLDRDCLLLGVGVLFGVRCHLQRD